MSGTVPQLRFPGFDGEWIERKVGDIFTVTRGRVLAMPLISSDQSDVFQFPVYSSQTKSEGLAGFYKDYLFEDAVTWTTDGANAGEVRFREGKFFCTNVCGVLLNSEGEANRFTAAAIQKVSRDYVSYVGNPKLMNGVMASIPILTPIVAEQQKIADFLGTVDAKLDALRRKKSGLEAFKSGLMQRLFSQELRFVQDDGTEFPDWEEKKLGELSSWSSGGTPSKDNPTFWDGDIPWVSASSMHDPKVYDSDLRVTSSAIGKGTRISKKGSILLLVRGSMLYKRIPVCIAMRDVAFNQDVKALVAKSGIYSDFLYHWLNAQEAVLLSMVTGTGIGAGKLETSEIQGLSVGLPHPDEQRKIADALSALDAKIAAAAGQITHMETFKKGLLQQMFV